MIARDLLQEAVDELYGGQPADFLTRRKEFAAAARAARDREAAKAIAALRKPTRSAHVLNQLARREPERIDELLGLTDDAGAAAGGSRRDALRAMRELTTRRRRLIDDLTDRAFTGAGEDSPTPAVRDEVVATLNAAVGDPDVGAELAEGRLVHSHEWSGFGFSAADLALVPDDEPADEPEGADDSDDEDLPAGGSEEEDENEDEENPDEEDRDEEDQDEEDQDEENQDGEDYDEEDEEEEEEDGEEDGDEGEEAEDPDDDTGDNDPAAEARAALRDAERNVKAQQRAEQEQQDRIADLEDELTEAQIRLDEIRVAIRRAEMVQRRARAAVERVNGGR